MSTNEGARANPKSGQRPPAPPPSTAAPSPSPNPAGSGAPEWKYVERLARPPREPPARPVDRIVVPVEGTDREFEAQQRAVELACYLGVPVCALHVAPPTGGTPEDVFSYLDKECVKWRVQLDARVVRGTSVVDELVDELHVRDMVVVGTRRMASEYHVGSVAAQLVRRAPCPVQLVRLP